MPNQNSSSWSLQEHLGYPLPVHPHYVTPVDLLGFHGIDTGSQMELHATLGTLDYNAAQVVHDHPSHTLSDYETHLRSHATNVLDDYTTGGKLDGYGNLVESKFNSEQVVGLGPQSPPPANQLPPSPRKLLSHDRVSRVKGRSLFRTFHRTCCPATARSRPKATRLSKTRSVCCHNVTVPCGWRDDEGKKCGMLISYGDCSGHFSTAHGITNIAWDVKVICCWCPSEPQRVVTRKNILRHMKEVHLCCARSENGI
ncbi:hypothetical protein EDD15DRAFT_2245898 [Pisolithus albus]|nr:hypothetical protein EDD15DRAFT_2245898 [Pisolithus albus]